MLNPANVRIVPGSGGQGGTNPVLELLLFGGDPIPTSFVTLNRETLQGKSGLSRRCYEGPQGRQGSRYFLERT